MYILYPRKAVYNTMREITTIILILPFSGVCYSGEECESMGGTAQGVCANGFGVCCYGKFRVALQLYMILKAKISIISVYTSVITSVTIISL